MDELIKDLREALYGPAQWGDTVLMSRAIDALTNQQTELAALIEDNDSLRKSLNGESEARCALEDEVKALRRDAETYRWIRERAWYVDAAIYTLNLRDGWSDSPEPDVDDVEKAVHAAMADSALSAASHGGGDE